MVAATRRQLLELATSWMWQAVCLDKPNCSNHILCNICICICGCSCNLQLATCM